MTLRKRTRCGRLRRQRAPLILCKALLTCRIQLLDAVPMAQDARADERGDERACAELEESCSLLIRVSAAPQ
jgi:hypothetical protein